jgi:hypothetical protein
MHGVAEIDVRAGSRDSCQSLDRVLAICVVLAFGFS